MEMPAKGPNIMECLKIPVGPLSLYAKGKSIWSITKEIKTELIIKLFKTLNKYSRYNFKFKFTIKGLSNNKKNTKTRNLSFARRYSGISLISILVPHAITKNKIGLLIILILLKDIKKIKQMLKNKK